MKPEDKAAYITDQEKDERKLSWEETYKAMAAEREDWEDFEATLDALWAVEAEERIDAYERGEIAAIPAQEIFAKNKGGFRGNTEYYIKKFDKNS